MPKMCRLFWGKKLQNRRS